MYLQFQYKLGGPSQWEMLHYDKKGDKYDCHIDTVNYDNGYARKLTIMGYLNDEYKGGKFYFMTHSDERHYVDIGKGSVLVFPPYWMYPHAGLRVLKGTKYIMSTYLHLR